MSLLARTMSRPVREVRKQLGLTQAELAKRAGVSRQTIMRLENNEVEGISFGKILAILDALGLELTVNPASNSGVKWKDGDEVDLDEGLLFLPPDGEYKFTRHSTPEEDAELTRKYKEKYGLDRDSSLEPMDYKAIAASWGDVA